MPQPNKEKWLHISQGFQENSDFPNCIGAVDGKHIRIVKPFHCHRVITQLQLINIIIIIIIIIIT